MAKSRGRQHTTLTSTARAVIRIIEKLPGIKMIAPGEIASQRSRSQRITVSHTTSGLLLTISGSGIQRVAVHTVDSAVNTQILTILQEAKALKKFIISERTCMPGQ